MGWNPGDEREMFTVAELEKEFSAEKISKAGAVFNRDKLNWYNKEYIKKMDIVELTERALPFLRNAGLVSEHKNTPWLQKVVALEKERMTVLSELPESLGFIFADTLEYDPTILIWKKDTREGSKEKLTMLYEFLKGVSESNWNLETLTEKIKNWISEKVLEWVMFCGPCASHSRAVKIPLDHLKLQMHWGEKKLSNVLNGLFHCYKT